ncbi:MAG TPA: hypothetical protein VIU38_13950 [Anaerolineales bacterium]
MSPTAGKPKSRKLSRGQRTHVRRAKEEARRSGIAYRPPFGVARPPGTIKKEAPPT